MSPVPLSDRVTACTGPETACTGAEYRSTRYARMCMLPAVPIVCCRFRGYTSYDRAIMLNGVCVRSLRVHVPCARFSGLRGQNRCTAARVVAARGPSINGSYFTPGGRRGCCHRPLFSCWAWLGPTHQCHQHSGFPVRLPSWGWGRVSTGRRYHQSINPQRPSRLKL